MNTAAKGRRNEHRSMALYEAMGYECIRSAGSRGRWDFLAIDAHWIIAVQVKSGSWPSPAERKAMEDASLPDGTRRVVHRWQARARRPDVRSWVYPLGWIDEPLHWGKP